MLVLHDDDAFFATPSDVPFKLYPEHQMQFMKSMHFITVIAEEKSIRKASEKLAITPSALNRRLLAIEEELSCQLFERLASGVRLNTAGELFIHHIKRQQSDLDRVRSQIADLEGIRRGHVSIASSQHAQTGFLVDELSQYRNAYPDVTFSVITCERDAAQNHLKDLNADLALTLGPVISSGFKTLATASITPVALMRPDHPLAASNMIRFYDCADYPIILPRQTDEISEMIQQTEIATGVQLRAITRADSKDFREELLVCEDAISFHLPIKMSPPNYGLVRVALYPSDMPPLLMRLIQLENRVLSVAASKFAEQLVGYIETKFNS